MTYTGEDKYFYQGVSYQDPDFGHHANIEVGLPGEPYDLSEVGSDCEKSMDFEWSAIAVPGFVSSPGVTFGEYPEGTGFLLTTNTTIVLSSHHVNYSAEPIYVNDRFDIYLKEPDQIEQAAAPFQLGDTDIVIQKDLRECI